jgi:PPP family 3-phenylpropionic acid transporter
MKLNLSFYYFFYFAVVGIYVIFFPNYLKNLGYSAKEIGIIFASLPIARFITPFFFQKKTITTSIFKISLFISVIVPFLFFVNNFYIYLLSFTILGVVWSINFPYIEAVAINKLGSHYGKIRLWGSIGFIMIALFLSYFNFNLILLFIILNLITAYFALYFINPDFTLSKHYKKIDFLKEWQFWVALILLQISFGGFYNFFTIYNLTNGIPKEINGWLWTIGVVAEIVIFIFQYKFLNRDNSLFYLKISLFMTSIRWGILYFFAGDVILIAISQILHLFSFAIFHTSALLYISTKYKNQTLIQQFYAGIGYGLAAFLGSFISGYLYGKNLFLYEAIIVFIGFLILWSKK